MEEEKEFQKGLYKISGMRGVLSFNTEEGLKKYAHGNDYEFIRALRDGENLCVAAREFCGTSEGEECSCKSLEDGLSNTD